MIIYHGTPRGGLNAAYKEGVCREVEAPNVTSAYLMAYDKHDHIPGGIMGVEVVPKDVFESQVALSKQVVAELIAEENS